MSAHQNHDRRSRAGKSAKRQPRLGPLAVLLPYLRRYWLVVALSLAALVLAAGSMLALPLAVREVIDAVSTYGDRTALDRHFAWLFGAAAVVAIFSAARHFLIGWLGERVVADLRTDLYAQVVDLSPTFFEATRTGEVLSRLTTDTTLVRSTAGANLSITLRSLVMMLGALIALVLTSPGLTAVTLVLIPLVLVPILYFGRRVRRLTRLSQDRVADTSGIAGETLSAIQTVQAFNLERVQTQRYSAAVDESFSAAVQRYRSRAWLSFYAVLTVFGAILLVLRMGAHSVLDGTMTVGTLGQFLLYALIVAACAVSLSEMWGQLQQAAGALERIAELLSARAEIRAPARPVHLPAPPRGRIEFDAVRFRYPTRPDVFALDGLDLVVEPGETVALVGPSGAGKSTVLQLLLRFYDPEFGQVRVDGVDLSQVDPREVRQCMAIVPQDTVVFAASAYENIRYGRPDAPQHAVLAAARAAAADEFISALPGGYQAQLGERGTRLSGGQRQRIAIARAILRDPPIMLLDEATSALDTESERLVHDALRELMRARTTLVIAHRLSTVREADRIVVVDRGRVAAVGNHRSLLDQSSIYARLANQQFLSNEVA